MTRILTATERSLIRGGIRSAYFRSEARLEALKKAETAVPAMKKDGSRKMRNGKGMFSRTYLCACCGESGFKASDVVIDHIVAASSSPGSRDCPPGWTWEHLVDRILCDVSNLQVLCKGCHAKKSIDDKLKMRDGTFAKWVEENHPECPTCKQRKL